MIISIGGFFEQTIEFFRIAKMKANIQQNEYDAKYGKLTFELEKIKENKEPSKKNKN